MLEIEDVELIEQAVLAIIDKMNSMVASETISKYDVLYENKYANRFDEIQTTLRGAWIHLGRLKKRMQEND